MITHTHSRCLHVVSLPLEITRRVSRLSRASRATVRDCLSSQSTAWLAEASPSPHSSSRASRERQPSATRVATTAFRRDAPLGRLERASSVRRARRHRPRAKRRRGVRVAFAARGASQRDRGARTHRARVEELNLKRAVASRRAEGGGRGARDDANARDVGGGENASTTCD